VIPSPARRSIVRGRPRNAVVGAAQTPRAAPGRVQERRILPAFPEFRRGGPIVPLNCVLPEVLP